MTVALIEPAGERQAVGVFRPEYGHLIDGEWVGGSSGRTIELINPATGQPLSRVQAGDATDVDRAVQAAHRAFASWSQTHPRQRQLILQAMANKLRERLNDFAMMESLDNGKPIADSMGFDVPGTAEVLDYFASLPLHSQGTVTDFPDAISLVHREPLGVCAAIVPWNIPLYCTALKIGPALAAGNTVVVKPAESTGLAILEFFDACRDILPPGVVNIVTGYGAEAGEPLVRHPLVRKVSFTGSKPTARKIMSYASDNIIPQTMELGGKSANIICADADLDAAAEGVVMSTIFNKGEVCIAGTRTFIHEDVYDSFSDKLLTLLRQVRQGDPLDPATQIGPQASRIQYDKVLSHLARAAAEGARAIAGGSAASIPGFAGGFFVQPTVYDEVTNTMDVAQEEIFGPVTCLLRWRDADEVMTMANDSPYGLGGGVWTRDLARAHQFARRMQTGTVWINRYYNFMPGQPLGGYKQSGFGRENTAETMLHYTQTKAVIVNLSEGPIGLYGRAQASAEQQ